MRFDPNDMTLYYEDSNTPTVTKRNVIGVEYEIIDITSRSPEDFKRELGLSWGCILLGSWCFREGS